MVMRRRELVTTAAAATAGAFGLLATPMVRA
jgi:hypothetical protein